MGPELIAAMAAETQPLAVDVTRHFCSLPVWSTDLTRQE